MGLKHDGASSDIKPVSMIKTGVTGLDVTLGGGLPANSLYLIQGLAGSGKTTLACQIGFEHARQGMKVLILTLLADSHAKMLSHLRNFSFFEERLIGSEIILFSGYSALIRNGLQALVGAYRRNAGNRKAGHARHRRFPVCAHLCGIRLGNDRIRSFAQFTDFKHGVHDFHSVASGRQCH